MACEASSIFFDFIEVLSCTTTSEEVGCHLGQFAVGLGMQSFAVSGIPRVGEAIEPYIMFDGWPAEWASRYAQLSYVHHDPVIERTVRSDAPFIWSEALRGRELHGRSNQIMREAQDFGMLDGIAVPIHSSAGMHAIVTFSSQEIDLSHQQRAALHMAAIYAHGRIRDLLTNSSAAACVVHPIITERERDCIAWCAAGKTTWEISQILGIAEKTVEHHIAHAGAKLDVVNRPQLVAESWRRGLIR